MNDRIYQAIVAGFVGGCLSVLVFHQLFIWGMTQAGWMNGTVYSTRAIPPFGVPQIVSQAFWGGLWGILFAFVVPRLPVPFDGVLGGFLFGLVCPTLVAWLVVAPLRGQPLGNGFHMPGLVTTPLIQAVFGLGVMVFIALICKLFNWKWS
jgi:hypothetical protein